MTIGSSPPRARAPVAAALGVALVGLAVYANALGGAFVYDDLLNVLRNPWIRSAGAVTEAFRHQLAAFAPGYATSYYRPLAHVLLACVHAVAGERPLAYHLAIVLLHAATCAAAFALIRRVASSPDGDHRTRAAAIGALLFALHPVHVEAVAWVSGVMDVSCALLSVLTLLAATSARAWHRRGLAPAIFLAALLGKEPALMVLPAFAAFAVARGDLAERGRRRELLRTAASLGLAVAAYLAMRVAALGGLGAGGTRRVAVTFAEGLLTALALLGKYATLLLLPFGQSAVHDFRVATGLSDPRVWLGLAAAAAVSGIAWGVRRNPAAVLGIALAVLPLLPALYVPALGETLVGERYLYLPSVGLALLAAEAWDAVAGASLARRRAALAVVAVGAVAAAGATVARNRAWHDELTLWTDAVEKAPGSAAAQEYLGFALLTAGRPADALTSFRRALELDPTRRTARTNVAAALAALGRDDEAAGTAERVLAEDPGSAEAHAILAYALAARGELPRAVSEYERSVALAPDVASVHNGLAIALARLGDGAAAEAQFREAIRLDPSQPDYARNLKVLEGGPGEGAASP